MKQILEDLEVLIRNGQFEDVEAQLRKLGKFERAHAVAIANIARRVNLPTLAIKILHPVVRPQDRLQAPPSPLEKLEYAEALRRVGAVDESWQLLSEVNEDEYPQAQVYKIFCLFNQWKYDEALKILRKYVAVPSLTPYARHVGEINMAAALIHGGLLSEAEGSLRNLRKETKQAGFKLLYGNSLELSAQLLILQKKYSEALTVLQEGQEVLKVAGTMATLFVQKWTAIAESLRQNKATPELQQVFLQAKAEKHWETVRDCDLYIAFLEQDHSRFLRLYFGTPFESFRQRIRSFASKDFNLPKVFVWTSGATDTSVKVFLNLSNGKVEGRKNFDLPLGQAMHRFLILLSQDFYRPLSVLSAFGKLFPGEHMAVNSANRVHQIVKRCRAWIEEAKIDLEIEEIDGSYRFKIGPGLGLIVPAEPLPLQTEQLEWLALKNALPTAKFTISDVREVLSWSTSSAQRLLRWGLSEGHLIKSGQGSRTCYKIISKSSDPKS